MKKRILICLLVCFLCLSMTIPALAAGSAPRLVDGAGYLTQAEARDLLDRLDEISQRQGMDLVIVTVSSLDGRDITAYADDFYDDNGYASDGILLLIADRERQWAISTTGYGIAVFTDSIQDRMAEQFVPELSYGWYGEAFRTFADLCDGYVTRAKNNGSSNGETPFNPGRRLLICLGIGFVTALIATGFMRASLKTVYSRSGAAEYIRSGSLRITQSRDIYLYSQQHRSRRAQGNSGRSSTHMGSSGRTHGGSRGSF